MCYRFELLEFNDCLFENIDVHIQYNTIIHVLYTIMLSTISNDRKQKKLAQK